jgi:hypothetical protein
MYRQYKYIGQLILQLSCLISFIIIYLKYEKNLDLLKCLHSYRCKCELYYGIFTSVTSVST